MLNDKVIKDLVSELLNHLKNQKEVLFKLNQSVTNDTIYWIEHDYSFVTRYLETYIANNAKLFKATRKPRGNVLIILSYNEPFILSIIPILNALVAGNSVSIRSSSRANDFFLNIWVDSKIVEKHSLDLTVIESEMHEIYSTINQFENVYFFGGHKHARSLAAVCGERYIAFHPEIEGADTKAVLPTQPKNWSIEGDARDTLKQALSHSGQSCQRIHGIFLPNELKVEYVRNVNMLLKDDSFIQSHISTDFHVSEEQANIIYDLINKSNPKAVYKNGGDFPIVIDEPDPASEFVLSAFFVPTFWIIGYSEIDELIKNLTTRRYHLGLNIYGENNVEIEKVIDETRFSRYTVNISHIDISASEGWGGLSPTGFSGYQSWIEHFSYPIAIIG